MFEMAMSDSMGRLSRVVRPWRVSTWWPSDSHDAMQRSLLHLLRVAHSQKLDPATLVANFAEEHRGAYRRRLRRLAKRLNEGTSLVDALEQTPEVLSDDAVLAIRFGTQTGTLGLMFDQLVDGSNDVSDRARAGLRHTFFYAIMTTLILGGVVSFLAVFIVPTILKMQEEFWGDYPAQVPWIFQMFVSVTKTLYDHSFWLILALILVCVFVWSSGARRFFRRALATRWVRAVAQTRSAELLRLLSVCAEAGRPIPSAISTLARYHFDKSVRSRLLFARNEIEQGADVWISLADAHLLTPQEAATLSGSSSDQIRVWTMRRLAEWKQVQVARGSETLVTFVQPMVTLFFAAIVLLVAAAMITFLAQMINSLA